MDIHDQQPVSQAPSDLLRLLKKLKPDPRHYQIAVLASLVFCGIVFLSFPIHLRETLLVLLAAQATQFVGSRLTAQHFDPRSAMITALSLILLFRSNEPTWFFVAAVVAISSKFLVRINGKHVFNPANSAIVSLMLLSDAVWVSTGQWGNTAIAAFALACCGFLVLTRARRAETTLAFLGAYGLLVFTRTLWLGDPLAIPMHQVQNGALLLFAFFMISDPKTAPDAASGRIFYGALVALIGFTIQFAFYKPYGPLLALFLCAPCVPFIDHFLRGARYRWATAIPNDKPFTDRRLNPLSKEQHHANTHSAVHSSRHLYP